MFNVLNKIAATTLCLVCLSALAGCGGSLEGELGGDQMFLPLTNSARGHLVLDISRAGERGGLVFLFLDFAGHKVGSRQLNFPTAKTSWSWDIGRGAEFNGRPFYALRVVRLKGTQAPIGYTYRVAGVADKVHRGGITGTRP